ncbi:MAG: histidine kinase, partial [Acidobacteria bacterium]|nr:histidine kinase [Acidobacteriota bacterium]
MQINPHFLFNTLNSISALIDEDRKAAQKMLSRLGDFLRLTLKSPANQISSLEQELEFLTSYLQIEQVRFENRLNMTIDVEPSALSAKVPSLILQPIVENVFRHAVSKVDFANLHVRARRQGDVLELTVQDNGPGLPRDSDRTEGIGLRNTRTRLQTQYGAAHSLLLENAPEGGLVITIKIPFEAAA